MKDKNIEESKVLSMKTSSIMKRSSIEDYYFTEPKSSSDDVKARLRRAKEEAKRQKSFAN